MRESSTYLGFTLLHRGGKTGQRFPLPLPQLGYSVFLMDTPTPLAVRLARVVSTAIRDAGRTQQSIAETTGIAVNTLGRRLTGHTPFVVTELGAIAHELDVKVSDLIAAAEREVA